MDGHDNKEIAQILGIQYQSVKNHLSTLYKKLKARNMAQATKLLLFWNLIKTEVPGTDILNFDKEKLINHFKRILDPNNIQVSEEHVIETKEFLMKFGLYGEVYADRLKELRNDENGKTRE